LDYEDHLASYSIPLVQLHQKQKQRVSTFFFAQLANKLIAQNAVDGCAHNNEGKVGQEVERVFKVNMVLLNNILRRTGNQCMRASTAVMRASLLSSIPDKIQESTHCDAFQSTSAHLSRVLGF